MTQPNTPDQARLFSDIASGLASGMPEFQKIEIRFNSGADLRQWAARFGHRIPETAGQPYPNEGLADPSEATDWLIIEPAEWCGMEVALQSVEPITDEQRRHWIDSGRAERYVKWKLDRREEPRD